MKSSICKAIYWLLLVGCSFPIQGQAASITIDRLRCELKETPLGIDLAHPRLSWELKANSLQRNLVQTAYRIQVATTVDKLLQGAPDVWDSGKQQGKQTNNIECKGQALQSGQRYYWRVMVWDGSGRPVQWSTPSWWQMGLNPSDWKASWIRGSRTTPVEDSLLYADNPAPIFRKEFAAKGTVRRAILRIAGLGYYEAYLNGAKIGDCVLDPGWTDYSKRVYYNTFDVTHLVADNNSMGVMLGNGWYNPLPLKLWGRLNLREHLTIGEPCFIAQLDIEYKDGSSQQVVSDAAWKVTDGPIVRNNVYLGEKYDARKKQSGWNRVGYNDQTWSNSSLAVPPQGRLQAQPQPAIKITERITPASVRKLPNGHYMVDMGVNFAGVVQLTAKGGRGTAISLKYGELLHPDGTLNPMTSVAGQVKGPGVGGSGAPTVAIQEDQFILAGTNAEEYFQPRFTFHGFRYVEIGNYPGELRQSDVVGLRLNASVEATGHFACSDTLVNALQKITRNTFLSNLFSVQSDCPHREKFGYGGDIVVTADAYMANFDMANFYAKAVQDFADAVRPDGGLTETAPFVGISDAGLGGNSGPIGWGTAFPLLVDRLYTYYGDRELLRQQYPLVQQWVRFIGSTTTDGIIRVGLSDHESINPKPVALTSTAFYYYNVQLLTKFARILGDAEHVGQYEQLSNRIKAAFIQHFYQSGAGRFDNETQTAQAFALYFGLVPNQDVPLAVDRLLHAIAQEGGHVSTGIFGTQYMSLVLSRHGLGQTALDVVTKSGFPGWAYMLENGATSLWEHWAYSDNTFSHNHPMFGSVSEWFYKCIAGIQPDSDATGFDKIVIRPDILPALTWAEASCQTINGTVSSKWKKENGHFMLDVTIPVNTTAKIYIPTDELDAVTEGGKKITASKEIRFHAMEQNYAVLTVGSGTYRFKSGQ